MNIPWDKTFDLIAIVLGSGGVLSMLYAKRERKAAAQEREATAKEREANADLLTANVAKVSQEVYNGIIDNLRKEILELKNDVLMLRKIVESYKNTCDNCPQRMIKKD